MSLQAQPAPVSDWLCPILTLIPHPALLPVPPSISGETAFPKEVQATQESVVTLECEALGSPPPQISWLKNGHPLLLSPWARLLSGDSVLRSVSGLHPQCLVVESPGQRIKCHEQIPVYKSC